MASTARVSQQSKSLLPAPPVDAEMGRGVKESIGTADQGKRSPKADKTLLPLRKAVIESTGWTEEFTLTITCQKESVES